ncbi:MAG: hypothetical protein R2788_07640 [Saprospiraceae bacterium]
MSSGAFAERGLNVVYKDYPVEMAALTRPSPKPKNWTSLLS